MLDASVVRSIRKLLGGGVSRRQVARLTGVSRGRIIRIARDLYPDYEALRESRKRQQATPSRTIDRCRTCGAMVRMSCLACHVRRVLALGVKRPYRAEPEHGLQASLDLQLKKAHRQRYEEVRAKLDWPRRGHSGPEKVQPWLR